MALAAYRHTLRAARLAFEGDIPRLHAARHALRTGFEHDRHLAPASEAARARIAHAEGVAQVLRENVVQGRAVAIAAAEKEHQEEKEEGLRYQLRIHEYTERGDNESVKKAGWQRNTLVAGGVGGGGCCSA